MSEYNADSGPVQDDAGSDQEQELSLDSVLNDAFDAMESDDSAPTGKGSNDDTPSTGEKSAKSEATEPGDEEPGIPQKEPQTKTTDAINAPSHWPKERQDVFNSLPKHAKKAWMDQAKDYERGLSDQGQKYAETKKFAEEVDQVFKPFEGDLQQLGLTKSQAVTKLLNLYTGLVKDPHGTIAFLMQQTGVGPDVFQKGQQGQQPQTKQEWQDPALLSVRQQLEQVQQRNAMIEKALSNVWKEGAVGRNAALISEMSQAKDENGEPVYAYFDDKMAPIMAKIITETPAIKAIRDPKQRFHMAYEIAVARNHKSLTQAEIDRRLAEQNTQKSRKAGAVRPQPGAHSPTKQTRGSLDDIVDDVMDQFGIE